MSLSFLLQGVVVENAADGVKDVPLWDIIKDSSQGFGLVINVILALMLGYAIFIFVERFLALRKATKEEQGFISKIKEYLNDGKIDSAKGYCSRSRLSFLATAAGAAPMIGFLGTTIGMIMVFFDLQNSAEINVETIAPGTMTAMVTTVAGLVVGIVSYIGYNYLVGKIGKVVYQMENDALEFMDVLHQPGK